MRVLILLLYQLSYQFLSTGVIVSIPFNRCASLQLNSILSNFARSCSHFISEFISSVPNSLCFSPPSRPFSSVIGFHPTAFHISDASAISSFFRNRWFIVKILRSFVSYLFNFVILTGEFNSAIRVHHILIILVILFHVGDSFSLSWLFIPLFSSGVLNISRKFRAFNSFNYFEVLNLI